MGQTNFWFMNIKPQGSKEGYNKNHALLFCQSKSIIGLGWPVSKEVHSVKEAEQALIGEKHPGKWKTVLTFIKKMDKDSYVWIFHKLERVYFLCKVTSDWVNKPRSEMPWGNHDIGWYREAKWKEIPLNLVPSPILRNPHMSTLCHVNLSSSTENYLVKLFNNKISFNEDMSDSEIKEILKDEKANEIIDLFDPYEIEDIVCNYIQGKGWRLIKSTASKSLPDFEAIFRRSDKTPKVAYVQVKSGKQKISEKEIELYEKLTKNGKSLIYTFEQQDNNHTYPEFINRITSEDIKEYILTHLPELDPETRFKLYAQM